MVMQIWRRLGFGRKSSLSCELYHIEEILGYIVLERGVNVQEYESTRRIQHCIHTHEITVASIGKTSLVV